MFVILLVLSWCTNKITRPSDFVETDKTRESLDKIAHFFIYTTNP